MSRKDRRPWMARDEHNGIMGCLGCLFVVAVLCIAAALIVGLIMFGKRSEATTTKEPINHVQRDELRQP